MNSIAAFTFDEGGGLEKRIKEAKATIKNIYLLEKLKQETTSLQMLCPLNQITFCPVIILSPNVIDQKQRH